MCHCCCKARQSPVFSVVRNNSRDVFEFNLLFTGELSWKGLIAAFCRLALGFVRLIRCSSAVFCGSAVFTTSGAFTEFPGCFRVQAVMADLTSDSSAPSEDKCVCRGTQCFYCIATMKSRTCSCDVELMQSSIILQCMTSGSIISLPKLKGRLSSVRSGLYTVIKVSAQGGCHNISTAD